MYHFNQRLVLWICILFAIVGILACQKNPTEGTPEKPALPPAQSMQIDLSTFGVGGGSLAKIAEPATQANFNNAAVRVALINTVVLVNMTIPTAIFVAAISNKPTLEEDAKFHWVYQVTIGLATYKADLAGWVDRQNAKVVWEMYATNPSLNPALNNFLWYEGWSNIANNQGQWTFYDVQQPGAKVPAITIDWSYKNEKDAELLFSNVWQSHDEQGDTLQYRVKNTDCSIQFYDKSEDLTSIIFWDAVTTAGYLQVPDYNNGQPAYWDENHNDM